MATKLPPRPWHTLASDLFELNNQTYLVVVNYFSKYIEFTQLSSVTSKEVIENLKQIFARHGIPMTLRTDPGSQYMAKELADFTRIWGFQHITNSLRIFSKQWSSGSSSKNYKEHTEKSKEPIYVPASPWITPMDFGYSPSKLLMARRLRTNIPMHLKLRPSGQTSNSFGLGMNTRRLNNSTHTIRNTEQENWDHLNLEP